MIFCPIYVDMNDRIIEVLSVEGGEPPREERQLDAVLRSRRSSVGSDDLAGERAVFIAELRTW